MYLISVPYYVGDRWATELLTTWFVGKRETGYIKSADAGGGSEMEQGMAVQLCGF